MTRRKRKILRRMLAIALGLSLVAMLEFVLILGGWGNREDVSDPFVGFSDVRPLFVLDESGDRREIPKSRQAFFRPESFSAKRKPGEYRIFCLGGSTVQGRPWSIETSFTTWLELSLHAADESRDWEVVNCGGVSYASYRLAPILREVLAYEPDLLIVCTGHNEFLEDREYASVRQSPPWLTSIHEAVSTLRIYGVLRQLMLKIRPAEPVKIPTLNAEVDALLDHRNGLLKYERDDQRQTAVIAHFEHNLRSMVQMAGDAGVPLWLVNPASNLRDTRPFKSQHRSDFPDADRGRFDRLLQEAVDADWSHVAQKEALVDQLLGMDDRYADTYYLRGRVYEARERYSEAKTAYQRAKDEDIVPLRMLESMHDALQNVAHQTDCPLIDIRALFEAEARHGIPGEEQLVDHVHPHIEGHQTIADAILNEMIQRGIVSPTSGWEERRAESWKHHWTTLEFGYFSRGTDRLNALRQWAAGRSDVLDAVPDAGE